MVQIQVNGKPQAIDPDGTVADLLKMLELEAPRVVVECNRDIVPREQYAETTLQEGDQLEILHFVGGG